MQKATPPLPAIKFMSRTEGGKNDMNKDLIALQAKLDKAKSENSINFDIETLQSKLNHLKLQAELNPKAVANISKDIEKAIHQKITISNVETDSGQMTENANQTGQKFGDSIKQGISKALDGFKNAGRNKMLFLTGICLL